MLTYPWFEISPIYFCIRDVLKKEDHIHNVYSYFCHINLMIIINDYIEKHFLKNFVYPSYIAFQFFSIDGCINVQGENLL